jgi:hypothetical protein
MAVKAHTTRYCTFQELAGRSFGNIIQRTILENIKGTWLERLLRKVPLYILMIFVQCQVQSLCPGAIPVSSLSEN